MKKNFMTGFLAGALVFGAAGVFAVNYTVTQNPYPVLLNGQKAKIEGYNINDSTYFKLRDIADAVGGFDVDFQNNTIQLSKDGYVYDNDISKLTLTEEIKDYLAMCCMRIPAFTKNDLSSKEFIDDFIFYFYTGKETDLKKTTDQIYFGWKAPIVEEQFELLFGQDIPASIKLDEDGCYWVHTSDFGDICYVFDHASEKSNGLDVVYNRVSGDGEEVYGTTTCSISPANNQNGYIITSILSVNNEQYL